jgi:hypothetical protein
MSLLLSASLFALQASAATPAPDYGKSENWLCLPGRADICSTPLRTTALNPNGYGSTGLSTIEKDSGVDCFVVYPTVSRDSGMNSDLTPGEGEEKANVTSQFARFSGACKIYTPMYRQMTLAAVAAASAGADVTKPAMLAYADVRSAWKEYLAKHNKGRPYVLLGHSQGSLMIQQLIANEIEGKPEAKRLKLAIIPGFNLLVPQGKLVGGTLKQTPICSKAGETGCVMSWVSFRENNVPPSGSIFGVADKPGMTVACTNPARPGATGWVSLDSYWNTRSGLPVPGGPISWSSEGAPPTQFVRTEGLVSARCVNDGPRGYLALRTNADPKDKRTDRIGGEVGVMGMFIPGWGMHLADVSASMGDLVRHVESLDGRVKTGSGQPR